MIEVTEEINNIIAKIDKAKNEFDIAAWNNFKIDFSIDFSKRSVVTNQLKTEIGNISGFYAIFDQKCLYIGVGRPIWKRINAHYYASQGKDKAKKWVLFFKENRKPLTIFWKEFSITDNIKIDDKVRQLIEAVLTEKYKPIFENQ